MDDHTAEIVELQKQLTNKIAKLSQLLAKNKELTYDLSRVKLQNVARAAVLDDLQ